MKILIIRLGAIGDVIMTTPIPKAIKKAYPKSEIHYLVGKWSNDVLKHNPYIDSIIVVDEQWFFKKQFKHLKVLIQDIRKRHFDYGLVLDKSWLFNIFLFLCNVKHRYGFSREHHFINRILLEKSIKFLGEKKEYQNYSDILYTAFGLEYKYEDMSLFPTKEEKSTVDMYMDSYNWKFICIAPGGAINPGQKALQKRWPKKYYSKIIDHLLWKGKKVFIIGGDEDKNYNRFPKFEDHKNYYDLTGIYNIREVYHLLRKYCDTFIGHDTGTLHLAAAAKVKTIIALFGPTPAKRFAPKHAVVITSPDCPSSYNLDGTFNDQRYCMDKISVEEVEKCLK